MRTPELGRVQDWPQVNARLPPEDYEYINALARQLRLSRNQVLTLLVKHAREQRWTVTLSMVSERELESA